jgi:hypothetical protein
VPVTDFLSQVAVHSFRLDFEIVGDEVDEFVSQNCTGMKATASARRKSDENVTWTDG